MIGAAVEVPELEWCAQAVPHYDYLLEDAENGAILAGGHCIPVRLPSASRFVWHKVYTSTQRQGFPEKAAKDQQQALVLGAMIAEAEAHELLAAWEEAPTEMTDAIKPTLRKLLGAAGAHPEFVGLLRNC